ncbi:MAG: hypothetical protein JJU24_02135 [Natronohydrobacter sp.]|nr:hypothetical protein [Natronohydrobacter sp.]
MPNNIRNWISRLSETCGAFSEAERAALVSLAVPTESSERVRLALRIVALRSRLDDLAKRSECTSDTTMTEIAMTAVQDIAAPEPEPEPKTLPIRQIKTRKASFSAVSLDDAAGLLSAFGSLAGPPSQEPATDESPRKEAT